DAALAGLAAPRRPGTEAVGQGPRDLQAGAGSRKLCRPGDLDANGGSGPGQRALAGPAAPGQPAAGSGRLGGEALAAAALGLGVRVAEHEALAQALAGEVDLGAIHQRQAGGVDVDPHPGMLEHGIALALVAGQVGHVAPAGAAGALDAEAQAQGLRVALQEALDALQGGGGEGDGHDRGNLREQRAHYRRRAPRAAGPGVERSGPAGTAPRLPPRATATLPPFQMGFTTQ